MFDVSLHNAGSFGASPCAAPRAALRALRRLFLRPRLRNTAAVLSFIASNLLTCWTALSVTFASARRPTDHQVDALFPHGHPKQGRCLPRRRGAAPVLLLRPGGHPAATAGISRRARAAAAAAAVRLPRTAAGGFGTAGGVHSLHGMRIRHRVLPATTATAVRDLPSAATATPAGVRRPGEKTALFAPFIYKMHYFTKTGSGRT
jgi:hypothetical protein